ncbi:MAG: metallophosphoesterase [Candidatus Aminicenantes bacterium]
MTERNLSRKTCAITLILILITLWFGACKGGVLPEKDSEDFRFVFATDIHLMPHERAFEGFNQAITAINGLKPEPHFVIMGGDLVENRYTRTFDNAEKMFGLYHQATMKFRMPVHNVLGNNDIIRIPAESGVDSSHPELGKGMFKNRLGKGATYRSFDYNNWHFVLLDSLGRTENGGYRGYIDDDQLIWLKNDLDKTGTERPVCIALHIPLVTAYIQIERDNMMAPPSFLVVNNGTKVIKLLSGYNVRLVLQGHLHVVEEIKYKKTSYITGGILSGAKWEAPSWQGLPNGYVVIDVTGHEFSWKYQSYEWTLPEKE